MVPLPLMSKCKSWRQACAVPQHDHGHDIVWEDARHAEAQARMLLRPPSPAQQGGAGLLGVLDRSLSFSAGPGEAK